MTETIKQAEILVAGNWLMDMKHDGISFISLGKQLEVISWFWRTNSDISMLSHDFQTPEDSKIAKRA